MILFRLTPLWMVAKCMYILFGSRSCSSCNRKEKKKQSLETAFVHSILVSCSLDFRILARFSSPSHFFYRFHFIFFYSSVDLSYPLTALLSAS